MYQSPEYLVFMPCSGLGKKSKKIRKSLYVVEIQLLLWTEANLCKTFIYGKHGVMSCFLVGEPYCNLPHNFVLVLPGICCMIGESAHFWTANHQCKISNNEYPIPKSWPSIGHVFLISALVIEYKILVIFLLA